MSVRLGTASLVLALLAGACSGSQNNESSEAAPSSPVSSSSLDTVDSDASQAVIETTTSSPPVANYLTAGSDYIFDQAALHTFELNLSEEALAELDDDPAAEEYVEGALTFEGETLAAVGIRYKGSVGAFVGCLSGPDLLNPSGSKTCNKLSMKVKINWDDPKGEFFGLRKLQFHSMRLDPSQMHDRLGYWLFREMGVPAPRAVHARLVINGEYSGLYSLVEQVDGRFTREAFEDGTGNLYKEVWPVDIDGEVQTDDAYIDGLKTNEDDDPSVALISSFAAEVAATSPQDSADSASELVSKWMDLDEIMAYLVVDRTIRHDDGPFHYYCLTEECSNHNFYWYENPTDTTLHLIPWDLDNAFENIVADANPVTPVADEFGEMTADCEFYPYGSFQLEQRSAVCDPLFRIWAQLDADYERILDDFLTGPFAEDRIDELLDTWEAQIAEATGEAGQTHPDALDPDEWSSAMDRLRASLEHARSN